MKYRNLFSILGIIAASQAWAASGTKPRAHYFTPRVSFCAAALTELLPSHSVRAVSEENTLRALNLLRRFRVEVLNQPTVDVPAISEIEIDSESASNKDKVRVASQIRGLELNARLEQRGDEILWATIFRRSDALKNLVKLEAKTEKITEESTRYLPVANRISDWLHWGTMTALVMDLMVNAPAIVGPHRTPSQSVAALGLAALALGTSKFPALFVNTIKDFGKRMETTAQVAASEDPTRWHYFSIDSSMLDFELKILANYSDRSLAIPISFHNETASLVARLLEEVRIRYLIDLPEQVKETVLKKVWIHVDLLSVFDPERAEPAVVLAVRAALEPPRFNRPKPRSLKEKLDELSPAQEHAAVPVPAKL